MLTLDQVNEWQSDYEVEYERLDAQVIAMRASNTSLVTHEDLCIYEMAERGKRLCVCMRNILSAFAFADEYDMEVHIHRSNDDNKEWKVVFETGLGSWWCWGETFEDAVWFAARDWLVNGVGLDENKATEKLKKSFDNLCVP